MSPGSKRFEGKALLYVKNGTRSPAQCRERLHNEKQIVNFRFLFKGLRQSFSKMDKLHHPYE